jgi:diguanylate cyclase (GGDEF)-like protein
VIGRQYWNNMRFKTSSLLVIFFGVFSLSLLVYYYLLERDFREKYSSVSSLFNDIQRDQERINYGILQSTLYAYYNQDVIADDRRSLHENINKLLNQALLTQTHYSEVKLQLEQLKQDVDNYIETIEQYLMLNAGIKNSTVLLSTLDVKSNETFPAGSQQLRNLHLASDIITQTRRMLDDSHLKQLQPLIKAIKNQQYTPAQKELIDIFLTHISFIKKNYPQYIQSFHDIMGTRLRQDLDLIKQQFFSLTQTDISFLNRLAITLFVLIVIAVLTISFLLLRIDKENRVLVDLHESLKYATEHDALTGLLNRNSFENSIAQLTSPCVLLINICDFKLINDFYGTDNGDKLLIQIANLIRERFQQEQEFCYRVGNNEFAVVFDNCKSAYIDSVAKELNTLLSNKQYQLAGINYNLSVLIASSNQTPLLETADMAIKHMKTKTTNNIIQYSEALNVKEQIRTNLEMTQILHDALYENRILPYYQPIIDLQTRDIVKYEALVRLKLEDGSILPPVLFLPVAQQTPMYREITRIMINKAIAYFADKPYRFSINFSISDLEDEDINHTLLGQLTAFPEIVSRLDIELLETERVTDIKKIKKRIRELKNLGCQISLDDFGSGYSNFTTLTELDFDSLKIDGSMIKHILHSNEHLKAVKAIMKLVNELEIDSIAEFVQDEESAQLLSDLGVKYAQGYFFGKPAATIVEL